jgi:hypothetical protein
VAGHRRLHALHPRSKPEGGTPLGQVIVKFVGLCIHVDRKDFPTLPAEHRVILLSDPRREEINGIPVKPHVPILYFREPPTIEVPCLEAQGDRAFRLNGVHLRISNGTVGFAPDDTFGRVPHLLRPDDPRDPNEDVILNGAAPAVAYFDADHGILAACSTPRGAVGTSLTIDTGDEDPFLELSCFGKQSIRLAPDAILEIVNVAEHGEDDDDDYLLNYGILNQLPPNPQPPTTNIGGLETCSILAKIGLDFGPPCSNSVYP